MATLKPANPQQTATRRKELMLSLVTRVFAQLRKNGTKPVRVVDALGPRSEIFLGLRRSNETDLQARTRIIAELVTSYPLLASSPALDVSPV